MRTAHGVSGHTCPKDSWKRKALAEHLCRIRAESKLLRLLLGRHSLRTVRTSVRYAFCSAILEAESHYDK